MVQAYTGYSSGITMTPQSLPIPGREAEMTPNNAGGYAFIMNDWQRLERFLITGSEGGTYYVGQQKLTEQNAAVAIRCIKADGPRTVAMAREINLANRAPKTDQQLFLLALAMKHGDSATKDAVAFAAPMMLRTGTQLLHMVAMIDSMQAWGRGKRRLIANWFTSRSADDLAFQVVKYQNRDGWSMRDVLRVSHPKPPTPEHRAVFDVVCNRDNDLMPPLMHAYGAAHTDQGTAVERAIAGLRNGLPREALPTEAMNDPAVWTAMLPDMPLHALLRNLGRMSANGTLTVGSAAAGIVGTKLRDVDALRKARVHPFAVLLAMLVYKTGAGVRGNKTWVPVPVVVAALEDAYDMAFDSVTPTGKRILIGIDISGSMTQACVGTPIPTSTAAAAMALTLARLEPNAVVVQFDTAVQHIMPVTSRTGIAMLENAHGGGTDVSAPIRWASGERTELSRWKGDQTQLEPQRTEFDAIILLTDSETWAGRAHPAQALDTYRRQVNPRAKLICCSMAANHANVVDPNDPLSFGCAGLDASLPQMVADFVGA